MLAEGECSNHIFKHAGAGRFWCLGCCVPPSEAQRPYGESSSGMDTSTRSAAPPRLLLRRSPITTTSATAAASLLQQLAPPPSSTAAQHRLTA